MRVCVFDAAAWDDDGASVAQDGLDCRCAACLEQVARGRGTQSQAREAGQAWPCSGKGESARTDGEAGQCLAAPDGAYDAARSRARAAA